MQLSFSNLTLLHAAEREYILPHKVIFGCLVIVFHDEAHHGQLRSVDGEAQSVIPHRVEPCRKDKSMLAVMLLENKF